MVPNYIPIREILLFNAKLTNVHEPQCPLSARESHPHSTSGALSEKLDRFDILNLQTRRDRSRACSHSHSIMIEQLSLASL